jgi:hypothetical protein
MYKTVIAIDPGAKGSITWTTLEDNKPTSSPKVSKMPKDFEEMNALFKSITGELDRCLCFIEKVNMRPSDMHGGKAFGMMKLMKNSNRLKDCLKLNSIGFVEVHPMTWQNYLSLKAPKGVKEEKKDRKNRYKEVAQNQYPEIKCTLDNCDALLILSFGIKKLQLDKGYIIQNLPEIDNDLLF